MPRFAVGVAAVLWTAPLGLAAPAEAQQYDVIYSFTGVDGARPHAGLVEASDGALYGTTFSGGTYGAGVVFRVNKDGTGFWKLHDFSGSDGANSDGGLVEASDGALYGTTEAGGANNLGVVFGLNRDGTGFRTLHDFSYADGKHPRAGLVEASDGALYGTTHSGGAYDRGAVFKLNKDGTGFLILHDFSNGAGGAGYIDGAHPHGLAEGSDGALYGTTGSGGLYWYGNAYRLNKDGTGFLDLHDFNFDDGDAPYAGLIEGSDGALYGTTYIGGAYNDGVVFRVNKDGTGFRTLHDFNRHITGGQAPLAGLVEGMGGALYGTTQHGGVPGAYEYGVVFKVNKDGTGFLILHDFGGSDGAEPRAALIEASDGALYGTTEAGGLSDDGVVFRLTVRCEASLQVQGELHTPGSTLPIRIHIAHNRPETVTVPWELSLIDPWGRVVAERVTPPHTLEPGDVVDVKLALPLPEDLEEGTYTLRLGISGMGGTEGATTSFRVVGPSPKLTLQAR